LSGTTRADKEGRIGPFTLRGTAMPCKPLSLGEASAVRAWAKKPAISVTLRIGLLLFVQTHCE
jgi:hypothetical protein